MPALTISLRMWQNDRILQILRADRTADVRNDEQLLCRIVAEAKVSHEIADAYFRSFQFNSKAGAIGAISKAVDMEMGIKDPAHTDTGEPAKPKKILTPDKKEIVVDNLPVREGEGKVAAILRLHDEGLSNDQIISQGFNKSTVYRQVSEYKQRKKAAKDKLAATS